MNSDFNDWAELQNKANSILNKKILGIHPIIQLFIQPQNGNHIRIDFISHESRGSHLEKLTWCKSKDEERMNDPMEKIKLFGHYAPTFERESFILNDNSIQTLMNLAEKLIHNWEKESKTQNQPIVIDSVKHTINVHLDGDEQSVKWTIEPDEWKIIPTLKTLLLDLTAQQA